ncbi:MAG: riboflavin synthase [Planctomycetaceae bacterium]
MFTGLVEGIGILRAVESAADDVRLTIAVPATMSADDGCRVGDSVAINGCCLTAVAVDGERWSFQAGSETLSKTNLGRLAAGDAVNLERALPATGRFGGHIVQGHVDGVGTIRSIVPHGDWIDMTFTLPASLAAQLVPKGSICVDGISLTVVEATPDGFSVALIPQTLASTTLGQRSPGDAVNIETEILGKYVQKLLAARFGGVSAP